LRCPDLHHGWRQNQLLDEMLHRHTCSMPLEVNNGATLSSSWLSGRNAQACAGNISTWLHCGWLTLQALNAGHS
jgi:hypothetical protein